MALSKVAKKWVRALRSGKYKKTTGQLTKIDALGKETYCCLGVLCEVAIKDGLSVKKDILADEAQYDANTALLPRSVLEYAGLRETWAVYRTDKKGKNHDLTEANDSGKSFKQIADLIVKHSKTLFVEKA